MNKKILIFIFNYRHDDNARRWVELLSPYFETVVLDSGNDKIAGDFIQYPNIYYSGLFNEAKKLTEGKDYAWVGIICSDVTIEEKYTGNFISCLNWLLTTHNVGIWQAAPDSTSRSVHGHYKGTGEPQHKVWIEGWMQFTKKEVWDRMPIVDTEMNRLGWSIDTVAECLAYSMNLITVMDDRCQVHHPAERGYSEDDARLQGRKWEAETLKALGISRYRDALPIETPITHDYEYDISFIIPCRNRDEYKEGMEKNLAEMFSKYNYEIIYIEQDNEELFRLGQLRNIGCSLAKGRYIIIQDVDIIHLRPVNINEVANSNGTPVRLYDRITQLDVVEGKYVETITQRRGGTGACLLVLHSKWDELNGYSNLYRGWGSEDDTFREYAKIKTFLQNLGHITHPKMNVKNRAVNNFNKKVYNDYILTEKILHKSDGYRQMCYIFNRYKKVNNISTYGVLWMGVADGYKYKGLYEHYDKLEDAVNKKVIYTCITGKYDTLVPQPYIEGYDYICFTDDYTQDDVWEIRPIPEKIKGLSLVKQQRYVKTHPHELLPEYDYSIWIDANMIVQASPDELLKDYTIQIPKHPVRDCIYSEASACIRKEKDSPEIVIPQVDGYMEEGYPPHHGLVQSNIIIRKHNDPVCIKIMEDWWNEIEKGSHRDQLSFNYVCWKNRKLQGFRVFILDKYIYKSKYFKWLIKHGDHGDGKGVANKPIVARATNAVNSIFQVKQLERKPVIKPGPPTYPPIYSKIKKENGLKVKVYV